MDGGCPYGQYRDFLINKCLSCQPKCNGLHAVNKCASYCKSANCKALFGHYYDSLLKKCVLCADICGRHPAECSQYCQPPPPLATSPVLLLPLPAAPPRVADCRSRNSSSLSGSTIALYSLLTLCMVLLVSSFSLAFMTFRRRAKTSKQRPKEANLDREHGIKPGQRPSSKDFATNPSRPADREPSDDSSPTETCVCIHCFPDLKALGHGNRPQTAPSSQSVLHGTLIQTVGSVWTEEDLYTSKQAVQVEAAVG